MSDEKEVQEYLYKILVVGELGTGKTSIIKRFVHNIFSANYKSTIGVDFALKVMRWDESTEVRLQLWDIAGQERFGNMTRVYYKEAVGAFIVFDVSRIATFEAVAKWKADIDAKVRLPNNNPIPVVLLANKCDLPFADNFLSSSDMMDTYCRENGYLAWFATSAKDNLNIEKATKALVKVVLEPDMAKRNTGGSGASKPSHDSVRLGDTRSDKKAGCEC